jgi:hypothetical protein
VNEIYKGKLETLRQRIPVGLRHGLTILEKANGDIEQAIELFQQEMITLVISKTSVMEDVAAEHLIKANFDINLALKSIDEERYSLTERILRRYKDKEDALRIIVSTVEKEDKLVRNFWLDFNDVQKLSQEPFCLLTVFEWLSYNDHEGFDSAMNFHLDVVTDQIEKQLLLPKIAGIMRTAEEIYESQSEERQIKFKKRESLAPTPEFREQEDLFKARKHLIIDALHEFVKKHIDKFP